MEWLGGWLKSIILVILLATFVDILLPSQSMQRYVKTVISLFILLILLQPLLSIFQKHVPLDQLLADAMNSKGGGLLASTGAQGGSNQMQSLGSIQQQADQLKAKQEQQSQRIAQQQIEDLMKRSIEQAGVMDVQNVKVHTGKDNSGQLQIVRVEVSVSPRAPTVAVSSDKGSEPMKSVAIEPVKPVTVNISPDNKSTNGLNKEPTAGGNGYEQERTQIRMSINKDWQIPLDQIFVNVAADKLKS
ncbi:stage III sporulation protein AF [Paenibacillus sp. UNC451MF]|uniref:stage III sporulation protein AF n=1 Tax=Paenibacillus sp. UNC451MF TaxID=1449063 RepID=UPI00068D3DAE|nr:stage III sporulation protein AF [Paenibacillus sp. UNC451MF]